MAFISLFDDRAKPKGSRDPLGLEMIWTWFGRKIIGNLTTITSSTNNFAVALLGFYWANDSLGRNEQEIEKHELISFFLRYEQLANYLRYIAGDEKILGITRVRERMIDKDYPLRLGSEKKYQILSDQVGYGLWGFYSTALQAGEGVDAERGIIKGQNRIPTIKGRMIAGLIIEKLGADAGILRSLIDSKSVIDRNELDRLSRSFLTAITDHKVQKLLVSELLQGFTTKDDDSLQKQLWQRTQVLYESDNQFTDERHFALTLAEDRNHFPKIYAAITDIEQIDKVLYTLSSIFEYCQTKDGELIDDVAKELKQHFYETSFLPKSIPEGNFRNRPEIENLLNELQAKDWLAVLNRLVILNQAVMNERGGAPWIRVENNRLSVKYREGAKGVAEITDIQNQWRYSYFFNSYYAIASSRFLRKAS